MPSLDPAPAPPATPAARPASPPPAGDGPPPRPPAATDALLDAVLDDALAAIAADAGSVSRLEPDGRTLRLHRVAGAVGQPRLGCALTVPVALAGEPPIGGLTLHRAADAPFTAREERVLGLVVEGRLARAAHDELVAVVRTEAATRRATEDALRTSDLRFRRIFEANVLGIAIAGPEGVFEANDEYLRQAGATRAQLDAGEIDWQAITPPEEIAHDWAAFDELLATGAATPFEKEYVHADGTRVRIMLGASLLSRDPIRWIALTLDVSARHRAETALVERVRDWETLFELAPVPLCVADDPACRTIRGNAAFHAMIRNPPAPGPVLALPARPLPFRVERDGRTVPHEALPMQRAAATGAVVHDDRCTLVLADGTRIRLMSVATPLHDAAGRIRGALGAFVDITEQRAREELAHLQRAVSDTLAETLDYEETLRHIARLVVPSLADWSVLDLLEGHDEHGHPRIRRVAVAHADPARRADVDALRRFDPASVRGGLIVRAIETLEPQLLAVTGPTLVDDVVPDAEHAAILHRLGTGSLVVMPLLAHGQVRGALTFVRGRDRAPFAPRDLDALGEVGARAALALANAVLYRESQQASEAKSTFLATMSHELRTPLNAIMGYTWLLAGGVTGPVTPAQGEQLGRIKVAADHLLALIDEVLTLSRIEAGQEALHPEPLDARAAVLEIAELLAPTAAQRGLALETHLPDAPVPAVHDATRLRQVLLNLVSNAIKFTERGTVSLTLEATDDRLAIEVRDTGIGIAPAHLRRVFESFWRVESDARRRTDGAGLGLAISHRLVELMGGTLTAESTVGAGSVFRISVPRAIAAAGA